MVRIYQFIKVSYWWPLGECFHSFLLLIIIANKPHVCALQTNVRTHRDHLYPAGFCQFIPQTLQQWHPNAEFPSPLEQHVLPDSIDSAKLICGNNV